MVYEEAEIDFPPIGVSKILDERLAQLFVFWEEVRLISGAAMPKRSDFLAEKLAPWWPALTLFEFEGEPRNMKLRFRVHGSDIVNLDRKDHTGQLLTEAYSPFLLERILPGYAFVAKTGRPVYQRREGGDLRGYPIVYEKLLLPFAGTDGALRYVLNCLYAQRPPRSVEAEDFQEAMRRGASRYLFKGTPTSNR